MKAAMALLLPLGLVAPALPPRLPQPDTIVSPKHLDLLKSLGKPMVVKIVDPLAVQPPPALKTLAVIPFLYSGTNKYYMIQWSTDLAGWTPIPELMNCILPASTNYDLVVTNTGPKRFFRAVGHDDFYMYSVPP